MTPNRQSFFKYSNLFYTDIIYSYIFPVYLKQKVKHIIGSSKIAFFRDFPYRKALQEKRSLGVPIVFVNTNVFNICVRRELKVRYMNEISHKIRKNIYYDKTNYN